MTFVLWCAITEVPCSDGKLYLSAVLDGFNGEIVGLARDDNMRKELCIQPLRTPCKARNARGMIYRSERSRQPIHEPCIPRAPG